MNIQVAEFSPMIALIMIVMGGAGLWLVISGIFGGVIAKKKCSVAVTAKCVDLHNSVRPPRAGSRGPRVLYCGIFTFWYEGKEYTVADALHSNIGVPEVGQEYEIFINPDNPEQMWRSKKKENIFTILGGVAFLFFTGFWIACYFI